MALSDSAIRKAKPADKPIRLFDIGCSVIHGAHDGACARSWNWSPGCYPSAVFISTGPVA